MGSSHSEPQRLETQITRLHDQLSDGYMALRRCRIVRGCANIVFSVVLILMLSALAFHAFLIRRSGAAKVLKAVARIEAPAILGLFAAWNFVSFLLHLINLNKRTKIEVTRYKMEKAIERYEKTVDLDAVKKALKASGKDTSGLLTFSISTSDYGVRTKFSHSNSIFTRIAQALVRDGPDYTYAVICPNCRQHNGFIDKSEMPTFKYKCPKCKCKVSTDKVISVEKDEASDDEMYIEELDIDM